MSGIFLRLKVDRCIRLKTSEPSVIRYLENVGTSSCYNSKIHNDLLQGEYGSMRAEEAYMLSRARSDVTYKHVDSE